MLECRRFWAVEFEVKLDRDSTHPPGYERPQTPVNSTGCEMAYQTPEKRKREPWKGFPLVPKELRRRDYATTMVIG